MQERLQQALLQWQHPAQRYSPDMLQLLQNKAQVAVDSLNARVQQWQDSFNALFNCLRHGHCPVVYVVSQLVQE
eukprot:jgi/Chrzof1/1202/Cz01g44160.t1